MTKSEMKPAVCWHTDPDEAFLVGTKESFRNLANQILEIIDEDKPNIQSNYIAGVKTNSIVSSEYLTEFGLDIVLEGITLVEKECDVIKVVNHFCELNGTRPFSEG